MSYASVFSKVLLSICLVFAFFACGQNEPGVAKLKVAINAGPEGDAIKTLAPEYDKAELEIVELPYSSLRQQLISSLGDDQPDFDVVMIDDPWFPQLASKLTTLKNVPDSIIEDIVTASLKLSRYPYGDGDLRALPFVGNTQLLFYRNDILLERGVATVPDQWEEIAALAVYIAAGPVAENGQKVYGYTIRGRTGAPIVTDFLPIFWSLGGRLVNDRGVPTAEAVDDEKLKKALRIYKTLQEASPPGATNFDWSEMTAAFTNGQAVFQLNWPAAIPKIDSAVKVQEGQQGWKVALPPGHQGKSGTSMIGNWLLSVPGDSENLKAAEAFILWLMEQQGRVAGSGNPPTRVSVFNELASKPGKAYFSVIREALERSTPRARTENWAQIEDAVSRAVSGFITDDLTEEQAVSLIKTNIGKLFQKS